MLKQDVVSLESARFNECMKENPEGSIFLGYLYVELVIADAIQLAGRETADLKIGMPDLQVRITRDGTPRVDFPADHKEIRGQSRRWISRYFSANRETRKVITSLVFALPAVSRAVERAERLRAA